MPSITAYRPNELIIDRDTHKETSRVVGINHGPNHYTVTATDGKIIWSPPIEKGFWKKVIITLPDYVVRAHSQSGYEVMERTPQWQYYWFGQRQDTYPDYIDNDTDGNKYDIPNPLGTYFIAESTGTGWDWKSFKPTLDINLLDHQQLTRKCEMKTRKYKLLIEEASKESEYGLAAGALVTVSKVVPELNAAKESASVLQAEYDTERYKNPRGSRKLREIEEKIQTNNRTIEYYEQQLTIVENKKKEIRLAMAAAANICEHVTPETPAVPPETPAVPPETPAVPRDPPRQARDDPCVKARKELYEFTNTVTSIKSKLTAGEYAIVKDGLETEFKRLKNAEDSACAEPLVRGGRRTRKSHSKRRKSTRRQRPRTKKN